MTDDLELPLGLEESGEANDIDGEQFVDNGTEDTAWSPLQDWQPAATFDVLYLINELGRHDKPGRLELHTFAYLACLMSIYRSWPASEWGYSFSAVPPTLPFSPAIEAALADLTASGRLLASTTATQDEEAPTEYAVSETGTDDLAFLSGLETFTHRVQFLRAAATTALFSSMPAVVNSMTYETQLSRALRLDTARMLLTQVSAEPLYREFDALVAALGSDHEDLIIPASLYVQFLQHRSRHRLSQPEHERSDVDSILDVDGDENGVSE